MLAGLVSLVLAFGPPALPPEDGQGIEAPPSETPTDPPEQPVEPPAEQPAEPPVEAPPEQPVETPPEQPVETPPPEDEPIAVTPPEEPPAEGPVAPPPTQRPSGPPVQRPGGSTVQPVAPAPVEPTPVAPAPVPPPEAKPAPQPAGREPEPEPESKPDAKQDDAKQEDKPKKKLGGFRLARLGVFGKLGYTNGISQKNGIFDRNKSIQDSINNQDPTISGGGDLGSTRFGGFQGGFGIDAEVVGINAWFDFHKFFRPGGMWSLLLGYDHEFGFGSRYRLDVGAGIGVQKVFLGKALEKLYYDKDNPLAVNIGTLGIEARAMADFHIKIVGPLFTGPYVMIGYHYLWSANAAEVTAEKGMHYSLGWTLRIDLATPKLLGRGRK